MTLRISIFTHPARVLSATVIAAVCLLMTACGGQRPVPTLAPTATLPEGVPTNVSLTPPPWREASQPISLENIASMERLGVLSVPEGSGTIYGYTLSADNTQLAALNESWLLAWDLVSGALLYQTSRQGEVQLFYSPTKETLYGLSADGSIYFYDSATGNEIDSRPSPAALGEAAFRGAYDYYRDTASLALGLENGDILIWDLIEGQEPQRLTPGNSASGPGDLAANRVIDLDFSSDGEMLAASYGVEQFNRVSLWNWREGSRTSDEATPAGVGTISQLSLSPDDGLLVGLTLNSIVAWNTASGENLYALPNNLNGGSLIFRFIPNTSLLLLGGVESNILIWDVERGAVIATLPDTGGSADSIAPIGVAISPDAQMLLTAKLDAPVTLWNLSNLSNGNVGRNAKPLGSPSIFDVLWTDDSFAVLMIDARGPVEVWGIP
jgi:WD40 repeat protein